MSRTETRQWHTGSRIQPASSAPTLTGPARPRTDPCSRLRGGDEPVLKRHVFWVGYAFLLLALVEAGARVAFSYRGLLDRLALNNDSVWRLRWVRETRATGRDRYSGIDQHHPRRGWALKPGLRDVEITDAGRTWKVSTNSGGLRGTAEYAPRPVTTRIAVYGDSFTFGEEVGDEQTYAHRLQSQLPNFEVLNFGTHGYGHDQIYLYMQDTMEHYDPDIVVVGYVRDNARRNMRGFRDFAKPRFVIDDRRPAGLRLVGVPVPD